MRIPALNWDQNLSNNIYTRIIVLLDALNWVHALNCTAPTRDHDCTGSGMPAAHFSRTRRSHEVQRVQQKIDARDCASDVPAVLVLER